MTTIHVHVLTQQRNHRCHPHTALSARHTHTFALRITLIAFAFGSLLTCADYGWQDIHRYDHVSWDGWVGFSLGSKGCVHTLTRPSSEARTAVRVCIYTIDMRIHFGPSGLIPCCPPCPTSFPLLGLFHLRGVSKGVSSLDLLGVNRTASGSAL